MKQRVMVGARRFNPSNCKLKLALNADILSGIGKSILQFLTEDIRKRGIVVPLLAKRDGTLLAGQTV